MAGGLGRWRIVAVAELVLLSLAGAIHILSAPVLPAELEGALEAPVELDDAFELPISIEDSPELLADFEEPAAFEESAGLSVELLEALDDSSEPPAEFSVGDSDFLADLEDAGLVQEEDLDSLTRESEYADTGQEHITTVAEDDGLRYVIGRPWRLQAKLAQCEFNTRRSRGDFGDRRGHRGWRSRMIADARHHGEYPQLGGVSNAWAWYKAFHDEGVRAIQAGQTRRMVIYRCMSGDGCGGNGDQIKGLLSLFYWAVQNRHLFFVQWERHNYQISKLLRPSYINWQFPDNVRCSGEEKLNLMTSSRQLFDQKLSVAKRHSTCIYVRSNLQPTKVRAALAGLPYRPGCAFHYLFQPSPLLMSTMAKRQVPMTSSGAYTAIHLRFGDHHMGAAGVSGASTRIGADHGMVLEASLDCARELDPDAQLPAVIYSDDLRVKEMAVDRGWMSRHAGGMTVDASRDESGNLVRPSHTDDKHRHEGMDQGVIDAWADQFGLASAARAVVTYSGFSRWALEIGMLPPEAIRYFGVLRTRPNKFQCKFSQYNVASWLDDQ